MQHITEGRSRNDSCSEKAISITHIECVFVALVIRHAKRMYRITVICGLSDTAFFPCYLINGTIFGGGLSNMERMF